MNTQKHKKLQKHTQESNGLYFRLLSINGKLLDSDKKMTENNNELRLTKNIVDAVKNKLLIGQLILESKVLDDEIPSWVTLSNGNKHLADEEFKVYYILSDGSSVDFLELLIVDKMLCFQRTSVSLFEYFVDDHENDTQQTFAILRCLSYMNDKIREHFSQIIL